jgi:membrane protease YdiL (CAAX protease family)
MRNTIKRVDWKFTIISFIIIFILQLIFALKGLFLLGGLTFSAYPIISIIFTRKADWGELGIRKIEEWTPVFLGILISGVIIALSYVINSIFIGNTAANYFYVVSLKDIELFNLHSSNQWGVMLLSGFIFCTMPSFTEEIYFRGFLLKNLECRFGFRIANIIQALCFGLVHIAYSWLVVFDINIIWSIVPSITLIGIVYGWARHKSNSIFSSIIVHSMSNLILFIIMYSIIIPQIL